MNMVTQLQHRHLIHTTADTTTTATTPLTTTDESKIFQFLDQPSKIISFENPVTVSVFSNKFLQPKI